VKACSGTFLLERFPPFYYPEKYRKMPEYRMELAEFTKDESKYT